VHALQAGQPEAGAILGHEFSGRIVALGPEVTGWREGQAVAASPIGSCGTCRICARGLPFRCPAVENIGITIPGAYAQYVKVPSRQLVALPDDLPVEVGSHAEPLSVGSQAVKLAGVGPGDPVLVYGVGPIGLYSIMALKLAGAGPIVAAGRSAGRRQAAADVGADVVIDTREISVADYAKQSGTLFAAVLECSAAPGAFNEALATTVEEEGVKRWLQQQGRDQDLAEHLLEQQRYLEVIALMSRTRGQLAALYASGLPPPLMRERKREAFEQLREAYSELRTQWGGHAPFEAWFGDDLNNADLASIATYYNCVPGFERELRAAGGDLTAFYARVRELAKLDQEKRDAIVCANP